MDKALEIHKRLKENGFESFNVGGYVRDLFLEKKSFDIDITTNAKPDDIFKLFPNCKQDIGTNFKISIIDDIEVATYRLDKYDYSSLNINRHNCKTEYAKNLIEDLMRRDFTINAMAENPFTGEIIDPFDGKLDIENKIIRFVGEPNKRILEDKVRILRGCRFAAILGFNIESKSLKEMKKFKRSFISDRSDRIRKEIKKTLSKAKKSSIFFKILNEIELLEIIFPNLYDCIDVPGGKYHDETVFDHNMYVGDIISTNNWLVKLAGYLHDCGKPKSLIVQEDGNESFPKHHRIGSNIIEDDLLNLKFSNREIDFITTLIRLHMRNYSSKRSIRNILIFLKEHNMNYFDWIRLFIADHNGNMKRSNLSYIKIKNIIEKFEAELLAKIPFDLKKINVSGYDIMKVYNIQPSPKIKEIQTKLFELILDGTLENKHEALMEFMKGNKDEIK